MERKEKTGRGRKAVERREVGGVGDKELVLLDNNNLVAGMCIFGPRG